MGMLEVIKIVFVPALIALFLYIVLAYVVVPLVRAYRSKYSNYLPMGAFSEQTESFRERLMDRLAAFVLPRRQEVVNATGGRRDSTHGEDIVFAAEDGERMVGFDVEHNGQRR